MRAEVQRSLRREGGFLAKALLGVVLALLLLAMA